MFGSGGDDQASKIFSIYIHIFFKPTTYTFIARHLEDTLIKSILHYIQSAHFIKSFFFLGIKPMTLAVHYTTV